MAMLSLPSWSTALKLRNATLAELLWKPMKIALPSTSGSRVAGHHGGPDDVTEAVEGGEGGGKGTVEKSGLNPCPAAGTQIVEQHADVDALHLRARPGAIISFF